MNLPIHKAILSVEYGTNSNLWQEIHSSPKKKEITIISNLYTFHLNFLTSIQFTSISKKPPPNPPRAGKCVGNDDTSMKLRRINYRDVNSINNTDKSKHQSDPVEEIKEVSKDYKMEFFSEFKEKVAAEEFTLILIVA